MISQLEFLALFAEDLLDLRKLHDGGFSLALEPINIASIIQGVVDIFTPQAQAKNIMLTYEKEHRDQEIPTLIGDKRRMKQVLMNLIKNSIFFTAEGEI